MTAARTEILARVTAAIAGVRSEAAPRAYRRHGVLDGGSRAALFCERVGDYRADVHRVGEEDLERALAAICTEHMVETLAIPPALTIDLPGVRLLEDHGLTPQELDRADGALTECTAAVAETGTIILTAGGKDGRRALTLVPDLHICIVRESRISQLLPEALARIDSTLPITLVSGPSATSDIELSRVEGVHGPRTLIVLLVKETA